jgi:uncharacterized protein YbaR (Trm112 family)
MLDPELLDILACPETKEPVRPATPAEVEKLNRAIAAGTLVNRGGQKVSEKIEGGLVRQDGKYCYPVREDIPIMLIDEALPL